MSENNQSYYIWLDAKADDEEIPAWKRLDIVVRKWAVMSAHEKTLENYENTRNND